MALKIDAKFEGKLTYAFENDMRNLANLHRLNEIMNSTFNKTFYTFNRIVVLKGCVHYIFASFFFVSKREDL